MTGAKVNDGSLQAKDIAALPLMRGPRGAEGPPGAAAPPTQASRSAYTSRDIGATPVPLAPVSAFVDVLDLAVPAESGGYGASSGNVTATAPGRLVATATVTVHSDAAGATLYCRLIIASNGTAARAFGAVSNTSLVASSHVNLTVTGGTDVEAGTHNVRTQCSGGVAGFAFHRGNLTVVVTPR